MTARDRLDAARLRCEPTHVIARLEQATIAEEMAVICPRPPTATPTSVWPWVLLVAAVCLLAAAAVVPHAEPIAQVADGSEE